MFHLLLKKYSLNCTLAFSEESTFQLGYVFTVGLVTLDLIGTMACTPEQIISKYRNASCVVTAAVLYVALHLLIIRKLVSRPFDVSDFK